MYDFDKIINRSDTNSFKWDKYAGKDIIPMWVADMDYESPREVIEALSERVKHGIFGYTSSPAELLEVIVEMLATKYNWTVSPEWILWLPGIVTGVNIACRAYGNSGDEVLTSTPIYPPIMTAPSLSGRKLVKLPMLDIDNKWVHDIDQFKGAFNSKSELFILCNPQNPTGRMFTEEELLEMGDVCLKNDTIICSDEIHCDLIMDKEKQHIPIASLNYEIENRTVTLMAPSKTYNIAGIGCSFAVIKNDKLRRRFRRAMAGIVPYVNMFGFVSALAAYKHGGEWFSEVLDYIRENRDILEDYIEGIPYLSMAHVEATYLAWINCSEIPEFSEQFFLNAGLGLSNGSDFDGSGYMRLNFACPRPILEKAIDRIDKAISSIDRGIVH